MATAIPDGLTVTALTFTNCQARCRHLLTLRMSDRTIDEN